MDKQENDYDYHRYKKLLVEAVDEDKRLDLIDVLIEEGAGPAGSPADVGSGRDDGPNRRQGFGNVRKPRQFQT